MPFGSFLANPIVGKVAGSVVGGLLGNKFGRDDRGAINAANRDSNMGYLDSRPYITDLYKRGKGALNDQLNAGAYMGDTYAEMDPLARLGYNNMGNLGGQGFTDATNFMNLGRGFGQNYADLYNQASDNMLDNAINYATDPNNYQGLVDAATRDARRNLEENTLRGIDMNAARSGNANSSRAGIAEANAYRGFADREADTRARIQSDLIDRSMREQSDRLSNMTSANNNLAALYSNAFDQGGTASGLQTTAGGALQMDEQGRLSDARDRFERERDYAMNTLANYNSGILGRAPTSGTQYSPNMVNPLASTLGGMQAGFGFGGNMFDYFNRPRMSYGTTGANSMSKMIPFTDSFGFGVG